jgi:hypothetical protein
MDPRLVATAAAAGLATLALGCDRDGHAAMHSAAETREAPLPQGACSHSVCGSHYFVDAMPVAGCTIGTTCRLAIKLVASGDYHINDEYPYKFKADDAPGLELLGTDVGGKNVFSKVAKDWQKNDERTGTMAVTFKAVDTSVTSVGGVFKFSVCSPENCQLEQERVNASVQATR